MMLTILRLVLAIIVIGALVIFYGFVVEPRWLVVREVEIVDEDVPPAFDGTTVAFASDIHHGPYLSIERVRRLVARINRLEPDLILLGGDYVHRDAAFIGPCFNELARLRAPLGIYGVLGNHDHWEGAAHTRQAMGTAGITLLDNRAAWIEAGGARIKVGGVGDYWEDEQNLQPTVEDVGQDDFVILVSHNPDYVARLQTKLVDLMLSGHTHGGQVTLFGLWAPAVPSQYGQTYRAGLLHAEAADLFVTTGVGTITPPARFWARPEIVFLTLRSED